MPSQSGFRARQCNVDFALAPTAAKELPLHGEQPPALPSSTGTAVETLNYPKNAADAPSLRRGRIRGLLIVPSALDGTTDNLKNRALATDRRPAIAGQRGREAASGRLLSEPDISVSTEPGTFGPPVQLLSCVLLVRARCSDHVLRVKVDHARPPARADVRSVDQERHPGRVTLEPQLTLVAFVASWSALTLAVAQERMASAPPRSAKQPPAGSNSATGGVQWSGFGAGFGDPADSQSSC